MNKTRRAMIGLGALVVVVGLSTGWALDSRTQGTVAVNEAAKTSEAITVSPDIKPVNAQPKDASPEFDRSDLLLSQG